MLDLATAAFRDLGRAAATAADALTQFAYQWALGLMTPSQELQAYLDFIKDGGDPEFIYQIEEVFGIDPTFPVDLKEADEFGLV